LQLASSRAVLQYGMERNCNHKRTRVLILGAAGRDYHTFNTSFRTDPHTEVVGFTHAQARASGCETVLALTPVIFASP
jgi:hypothetical protein